MKTYWTILFLLLSQTVFSQQDFKYFQQETERSGLCYAQCMTQTKYDTISEKVLVKPGYTNMETMEPTFEYIDEKIEITPSRYEYKIVPAVYDTIEETVIVEEEYTYYDAGEQVVEADCFSNKQERIEIAPPGKKWTLQKSENCKSKDWDECVTLILEDTPTQYHETSVQVNDCPPSTPKEVLVPAKTETITRIVLVSPQQLTEVNVPAEYKTVKRKIIASYASTMLQEIPSEYKPVDKLIQFEAGGNVELKAVLCVDQLEKQLPVIQRKLKEKEFYKGKLDGKLTGKLKEAMINYQLQNGLPVGQFDYISLQQLGIKFKID